MKTNLARFMMALAVGASMLVAGKVEAALAAVDLKYDATPIGPMPTELNGNNLLFHQFDPALGTLHSVSLYLATTISSSVTVKNESSGAASATVMTTMTLFLNEPKLAPNSGFVAAGMYTFTPPILSGKSASETLTANASKYFVYDAKDAAAQLFVGTGSYKMGLTTSTYLWLLMGGGDFTGTQSSQGSATGWVQYNYTPVPAEPSTYLAGLGAFSILGVFGLRNRRK